jgi:hypothetical protein
VTNAEHSRLQSHMVLRDNFTPILPPLAAGITPQTGELRVEMSLAAAEAALAVAASCALGPRCSGTGFTDYQHAAPEF